MEIITDKGILNLINKTPHEINFYSGKDEVLTLSGTEQPIRLKERVKDRGSFQVNGSYKIPINTAENYKLTHCPPQRPDTYYIVSRAVGEYAQRPDFLVADDQIKKDGQIIGCKSFKKFC